jgi:myo-inositol 2-dehydrogenase/D-chiro-inositol 1-dehydrogenase
MIGIALFGAGRIGRVHAGNIAGNPRARLACVVDPDTEAAQRIADMTGARLATREEALAAHDVDAFIIGSPTDSHAGLLDAIAGLGKPSLCEKPISLDFDAARACCDRLDAAGARCMMGFHRRFDPGFGAVWRKVRSGDVGQIYQISVSSRSWAPPPPDYVARSGGLFRDQSIHDFDLVRFILGEPIVSVYAVGGCMIDERIGQLGDIDSAMITLVAASGALVSIQNGRFAAFGYDQRLEVFGTKVALAVDNVRSDTLVCGTGAGFLSSPPQKTFIERYATAYASELDRFLDFAEGADTEVATYHDGLFAQELAEAALRSYRTGSPTKVRC